MYRKFTEMILILISSSAAISNLAANEMDETIRELLRSHPEIKSLEANEKALKNEAGHLDVYPDPRIGVAYRNYPYRGSLSLDNRRPDTPTMTGIEYTVSQEIPYPGKLEMQKTLGKLSAVQFSYYAKERKNKFVRDFLEANLRIKYTRQRIRILKLMKENQNSLEKILKSSYITGSGNLAKILNARVNATEITDRILKLESEEFTVGKKLEYFQAKHEADSESFIDQKEKEIFSKILKEISFTDLEKSPAINQLYAESERAIAQKKLGDITHYPEAELFFSYMDRRNQRFLIDKGPLNYAVTDVTEYRGDLFSAGITMRVPVWSFFKSDSLHEKNSENINSANLRLEKEKARVLSELQQLIGKWKFQNDRLKLHRLRLIPELQESIRSVSNLYRTGKSDIAESIQLKVNLLEAHLTEEEIKEEKYVTLLQILETTGMLVPEEGR